MVRDVTPDRRFTTENRLPRRSRYRWSFAPMSQGEIVESSRRGDRSISRVSSDLQLTETVVRSSDNQVTAQASERNGFAIEE